MQSSYLRSHSEVQISKTDNIFDAVKILYNKHDGCIVANHGNVGTPKRIAIVAA